MKSLPRLTLDQFPIKHSRTEGALTHLEGCGGVEGLRKLARVRARASPSAGFSKNSSGAAAARKDVMAEECGPRASCDLLHREQSEKICDANTHTHAHARSKGKSCTTAHERGLHPSI